MKSGKGNFNNDLVSKVFKSQSDAFLTEAAYGSFTRESDLTLN
jgi:hypothetical protein